MWLIMGCERQAGPKLLNIFINTSKMENVAEGLMRPSSSTSASLGN